MNKKEFIVFLLIIILAVSLLFIDNYNRLTGKVIIEDYFNTVFWDHMPLNYYINHSSCGILMPERIKNAFYIISNESSFSVKFLELNESNNVDINIQCFENISFNKGFYESGSAKYYTGNSDSSKIVFAEIFFYNINPKSKNRFSGGCTGYPNTEIHEILHIFGFSHKKGYSIMNPLMDGCRVKNIDKEFINKLKELYR